MREAKLGDDLWSHFAKKANDEGWSPGDFFALMTLARERAEYYRRVVEEYEEDTGEGIVLEGQFLHHYQAMMEEQEDAELQASVLEGILDLLLRGKSVPSKAPRYLPPNALRGAMSVRYGHELVAAYFRRQARIETMAELWNACAKDYGDAWGDDARRALQKQMNAQEITWAAGDPHSFVGAVLKHLPG